MLGRIYTQDLMIYGPMTLRFVQDPGETGIPVFDADRQLTLGYRGNALFSWTVAPHSCPLSANAGPDQVVNEKVTLDGSGSNDPGGVIVSYQWQLKHESNSSFDQTATGMKPTVVNLEKGFYEVTLTVTDNSGLTDTDKMVLAVSGPGSNGTKVVVIPLN
ncbi:PKD domain-containing protein [Desulfoferrobacter suflitae]|uniref:PKD domain-containing protein n=1 Tax=Desulfoferrobacter suflitae TaxID=2865782 RepID=UPI002164609B|nr:PKD domain-containing protein [Desulfoferrobacter suflitae]MCK8601346.1 PKD domain-containing protein [Desulfoferrobacter suflitae]